MTEHKGNKRVRRISSWMADAAESIAREEEILAGKKIVLKIIRYMEDNNLTQKDLAQKLGVSPQYIHKFLHGIDCDIKVSTAIRYGNILNLKLIEIPDSEPPRKSDEVVVYATHTYKVDSIQNTGFTYNSFSLQHVNFR
ncbi:MAG: helix-turn-helix transcriptional regulator [Muribaculaceae bacterium]|nr:helix-turn-helix transcriptional regulator [Muribaculaceae bacterium]